jgi:hypothetical protein
LERNQLRQSNGINLRAWADANLRLLAPLPSVGSVLVLLALAPGGEVQKLLERHRLGQSVDSSDHTRLAQTLLEMYEGWRRMEPHNPAPSFFEQFSRRAQTEALSTLLGG